jgi:hypothetical protein
VSMVASLQFSVFSFQFSADVATPPGGDLDASVLKTEN